ncbi:hypothetical protein ColKHC_01138 [Colletotrichum higginsianum]|nr:hypothetical protein ColKHC_01138 [Colletotrichum higginsianum]
MVKNAPVPDAWEDDDWESAADKLDGGAPLQPEPEPQAPMSKAERLAQHAESNRKLWESADSPTPLTFLEAQPSVPLATGFKPQVKVLSRKPAPRTIARRDPVTGLLSHLSLADDDADDQRADAKPQLTPEEIRAKQQRELEEKQRRYEEARAKIFGESNPSSGASSPGTTTPPRGGENERGGGGAAAVGDAVVAADTEETTRVDKRTIDGPAAVDPTPFVPRAAVSSTTPATRPGGRLRVAEARGRLRSTFWPVNTEGRGPAQTGHASATWTGWEWKRFRLRQTRHQ